MINISEQERMQLMKFASMLHGEYKPEEPRRPKPKPSPIKKCLLCGDSHTHNNAFCSVNCSKWWRTL